jgi:NCS2 family nucleobase:cation symporter-2
VLGGVTTALYELIGIIGVMIWTDNYVDFSALTNQLTAASALVVAIAPYTSTVATVSLIGIALGTVAAVVVYHLMTAVAGARGTA